MPGSEPGPTHPRRADAACGLILLRGVGPDKAPAAVVNVIDVIRADRPIQNAQQREGFCTLKGGFLHSKGRVFTSGHGLLQTTLRDACDRFGCLDDAWKGNRRLCYGFPRRQGCAGWFVEANGGYHAVARQLAQSGLHL